MTVNDFELKCPFTPTGDQPQAIDTLTQGVVSQEKHQVLLGITGSGKTFTLANVIANTGRPTLVLAPNKTLAAQLFSEFRMLFPNNAVEYFISFYDYYQPEAYIPTTNTYIEKDSAINEHINKLRHHATINVISRRDVIVVASVSAIYGIGSPDAYKNLAITLEVGLEINQNDLVRLLTEMQYTRVVQNDLERGMFRVIGNRIDIYPMYNDLEAIRVTLTGSIVESISKIDPTTGFLYETIAKAELFPATHYVVPKAVQKHAIQSIQKELKTRLKELRHIGKIIEADRLEQRTNQDLEMIQHIGFCRGIENYSRHFEQRDTGEPPFTLLSYFPKDFLLILDESHITIPQLRGMYKGDQSRKRTLAEFGFRLPSALDNRPLNFEEFNATVGQTIYVSATPGTYEMTHLPASKVQQIIRPTGLLDPETHVFPAKTQVDHLISQMKEVIDRNNRILVLTLTKKMAETFTGFLQDLNIACAYLHSDVKTLDRTRILDQYRRGDFDVLVGINLLREGIDLPELELVAIFDADKEGFLRSETALIQMIGRAARNLRGKVFLYADRMTPAITHAINVTQHRRIMQDAHNKKHSIVPKSISKPLTNAVEDHLLAIGSGASEFEHKEMGELNEFDIALTQDEAGDKQKILKRIKQLRKEMRKAAQNLEFEKAHAIKQKVIEFENHLTD